MEEGFQIEQVDDPTADFHLTADLSNLIGYDIIKPKNKPDMIAVAVGLKLDNNQITRLKELPEEEREEFLWGVKFDLILAGYAFQFQPTNRMNYVEHVLITQSLWFDGTTKNSFMLTLEKVSNGRQFAAWKMGRELGFPNEPKGHLSSGSSG